MPSAAASAINPPSAVPMESASPSDFPAAESGRGMGAIDVTTRMHSLHFHAVRLTKQHLSRMACASAEEKINEPAGRFLRLRDDVMRPKVLAPAVVSRKSVNIVPGGNGRAAGVAKASGLCKRDCSHWSPLALDEQGVAPFTSRTMDRIPCAHSLRPCVLLRQNRKSVFLGSQFRAAHH